MWALWLGVLAFILAVISLHIGAPYTAAPLAFIAGMLIGPELRVEGRRVRARRK